MESIPKAKDPGPINVVFYEWKNLPRTWPSLILV